MKKLMILVLILTLMLVPNLIYASDLVDSAKPFATVESRANCEPDVDGITVCDYVYVQTSFESIESSNEYLNFTIPYLGYSDLLGNYTPSERSKLTFYDVDMEVLITVPIYEADIPTWTRSDYFILDLETDIFGVGTIPADLAFFGLTLIYQFGEPQDHSKVPDGFTEYLEEHMVYEIDDEIGATESLVMDTSTTTAYFYSNFEIYATVPMDVEGAIDLTYAPVFQPPNPKLAGYIFTGWFTSDGAKYDWGDYVDSEEFAPYRVHFYAGMVPITSTGDDSDIMGEGSIITDLLTMIGFNNEVGRVIAFTVIALIVMGIMVVLKMPIFVGAFVMLVLSTVFILIGWLPIYATVLIGLGSLTLIFMSLQRRAEE